MKKLAAVILGLGIYVAPLVVAQETKPAQEAKSETKSEAKEEKKGGMAEPSIGWEWANFVVLVGVVYYMAVKQGGPFFNSRAAGIRKGIDEAEKIKAESNAKIAAINSKLGRLDAEIVSMREAADSERRASEQRLKEGMKREIQRIEAHAAAEIETAGKAERIALQRYAAQLALHLAETKVRARMSSDAEDALVQAFVNDLGTPPARSQTRN